MRQPLEAAEGPEPILVRAPNPGIMTLEGTNSWVIPCPDGKIAVVDPGPADPGHIAALERRGEIRAVLLTHRHRDHSAAIELLAEGVPVYAASPAMARGVPPAVDGQEIALGSASIKVLKLPGHTDDSLGFALAPSGGRPVLFTGDALLGGRNSTLLVARDGGTLDAYLDTLERMSSLEGWRGAPGHGPAIADLAAHARGAIRHRVSRLDELRAALAADPGASLSALAEARYPGAPDRERIAIRMLEVEIAYLAGAGRREGTE